MGSVAEQYGVAAAGERPRPLIDDGLNWGLILAVAACLVFWCAVILGVVAIV